MRDRRIRMKSRVVVIIALFTLAAGALSAENDQKILPIDSPVVGLLNSIYLEQGKVPLSSAGPYSVDEILLMLEKLDRRTLSPAGKRAYEEIDILLESFLPAAPMAIGMAVRPSFALEGYLNTNPDPVTTEWEYGYNDRQALADLPIEAWAGDNVYALLDASARLNPSTLDETHVPSCYANIPLDLAWVDWEFPFRAFLSAGGRNWSFIIGRDRFSWGAGRTGTLAVSDSPHYYDFARLTGYWRDFKYTALWITLQYFLDPYRTPTWGPAGNLLKNDNYPRNYFLHRLDFTPWDNLSLSVTEGILVGGMDPDLMYFNPFTIFHNLFRFHHGAAMLELEARWNPWKYIEVYAEAAFNQIQSPFEYLVYGSAASDIANANAFVGGVNGRIPLWDGYIDAGAEAVYVSPWMYLRENRLMSFQWWRYQNTNVSGAPQWVSESLGYSTGPDSVAFAGWLGYDVTAFFSVRTQYTLTLKGEQDFETPYAEGPAAVALVAPSGIPEIRHVIRLGGTFDPLSFLGLGADIYGIFEMNHGHVAGASVTDFQFVLSAKVKM
jgi:hypothetical protein